MPESSLDRQESPSVPPEHKNANAVSEFLHSAAYSAFQEPVSGLVQIADAVAKTDLTAKVQFMAAPQSSETGANWWAQQAGGALGTLVPFLLARSGVRFLSGSAAEASLAAEAGQLKLGSAFGMSLKEAGMTGFAYNSVLRPTDANSSKNLGNFLLARTAEGAAGAATFMTLTASGFGMGKVAETSFLQDSAVLRSTLVPLLKNPVAAGFISGVPAGLVSAEANALAAGKVATSDELKQSVASMAVFGGLFGAGHMAFGKGADGTSAAGRFAESINSKWNYLKSDPPVLGASYDSVAPNTVRGIEQQAAETKTDAAPDAVNEARRNLVRAGESVVAQSGESYFAGRDSNVTANSGSTIFAESGSTVSARNGSIVIADKDADVIAEPGARVIRNESLERDARDAHKDGYSVFPGKSQEAGATVVRGQETVAGDGAKFIAEQGSTVVAQKGATVFAKQGAHVIAEEGSEVIAQYGSQVTARQGSLVKAYEGANVIAAEGANVQAWMHSRVIAEAGSSVRALSHSDVVALKGSSVLARDSATVHAFAGANVTAEANAEVHIYGDVKLQADPRSTIMVEGCVFTANAGVPIYAQNDATVYAKNGATVFAQKGSSVVAEAGSKVYGSGFGQVFAREGSYVWSKGNSITYALDGSTVYADRGAAVFASEGSKVHANDGAHIFAGKDSEIFALPGSRIIADEGAVVHADPRARVINADEANLSPLSDQHIKSPVPANLTPEETVKWMQALSVENRNEVRGFIKQIDFEYELNSGFNFKDPEKIASKAVRPSILERKPWHDVAHIRDAFRFKTVLDDIGVLPKVVEELQKRDGWKIVKVDVDKALNPGEWGWRIMAFDLRLPNGQLVEYYLPVEELEQAKKNGNHELFEKWRNSKVDE